VDTTDVIEFLKYEGDFERNGRLLQLRDLSRKVCIVSFNLRSGKLGEGDDMRRPWGARMFHNLLPDGQAEDCPPDWRDGNFRSTYYGEWPTDHDQTLVEVMMRSGAMPVLIPMQSGHVDGAVFANNPCMAAVAETLGSLPWINDAYNRDNTGKSHKRGWIRGTQDLLVLSMGGDDYRFADDEADKLLDLFADPNRDTPASALQWGWWQWLLRLKAPLLALKLLINGDGRGIGYQTMQVLAPGSFMRIGAAAKGGIVGNFVGTMLGDGLLSKLLSGGSAADLAQERADAWAAHSAAIDELLDQIVPIDSAPPARVGRPGTSMADATAEPTPQQAELMQLFKDLDTICVDVVDERGEEDGLTSRRVFEGLLKAGQVLQAFALRSHAHGVDIEDNKQKIEGDLLPRLLEALANAGGSAKDEFPVNYLVAALWVRVAWLTPDLDELSPTLRKKYGHTGSLWRVLSDPFYQAHWWTHVEAMIDANTQVPKGSTRA